jgi:hypothetical protein
MEAIFATLAGLFKPDERSIMHRCYATRLAMVVGIILIAGWFCYELVANQHLRWDLAIIGGTMAVTKVLAMLYYRATR